MITACRRRLCSERLQPHSRDDDRWRPACDAVVADDARHTIGKLLSTSAVGVGVNNAFPRPTSVTPSPSESEAALDCMFGLRM